MTRTYVLFGLLAFAPTASAAPITYNFYDNSSNALLFTFSVNSPPAGSALNWNTSNTADLTAFTIHQQSFLPSGTAPFSAPLPPDTFSMANAGDPSLLPQAVSIADATTPFGGTASAYTLGITGPSPSSLGYSWLASFGRGGTVPITMSGTGRIEVAQTDPVPGSEPTPEPATLAVFGLLAACGGVVARRRRGEDGGQARR